MPDDALGLLQGDGRSKGNYWSHFNYCYFGWGDLYHVTIGLFFFFLAHLVSKCLHSFLLACSGSQFRTLLIGCNLLRKTALLGRVGFILEAVTTSDGCESQVCFSVRAAASASTRWKELKQIWKRCSSWQEIMRNTSVKRRALSEVSSEVRPCAALSCSYLCGLSWWGFCTSWLCWNPPVARLAGVKSIVNRFFIT